MSQAHLEELHKALSRHGWQVTERRRGDEGANGAGTWQLRRYEGGPPLLLDFAGFGGLGEDIPLEESYACQLRGTNRHLYFSRINKSRKRWLSELESFMRFIDDQR